MARNTVTRLGALALCCCLLLTLNLHGCGQFYRDNTQHQWLVNFQKYSTTTTKATVKTGVSSEAFVGAVTTQLAGRLADPKLGELSGLAAASDSNKLWAINDSGNPSTLYAITPAGKVLGLGIA